MFEYTNDPHARGAEGLGGWQMMPRQEVGWQDNRPDSRISYAPMQIDVDIPCTPLQHHRDPHRPLSALPFPFQCASDLIRHATPYPRPTSARPMYRPQPSPIAEPSPRYPTHPIRADTPRAPQTTQTRQVRPAPPPFTLRRDGRGGIGYEAAPEPTGHDAPPLLPPAPITPLPNHPNLHAAPQPDLAGIAKEEEGDDLFVTPEPTGDGWPVVQGDKPDWQYSNMTDAMATSWQGRTFPRCLIAMAGEGACDPGEA